MSALGVTMPCVVTHTLMAAVGPKSALGTSLSAHGSLGGSELDREGKGMRQDIHRGPFSLEPLSTLCVTQGHNFGLNMGGGGG